VQCTGIQARFRQCRQDAGSKRHLATAAQSGSRACEDPNERATRRGSSVLASRSRCAATQWTLKFAKGQLELKLFSHTNQLTLLHCTQCLAARWRQCVAKTDVCVRALVRDGADSGLWTRCRRAAAHLLPRPPYAIINCASKTSLNTTHTQHTQHTHSTHTHSAHTQSTHRNTGGFLDSELLHLLLP
jgi:hypothetical protein